MGFEVYNRAEQGRSRNRYWDHNLSVQPSLLYYKLFTQIAVQFHIHGSFACIGWETLHVFRSVGLPSPASPPIPPPWSPRASLTYKASLYQGRGTRPPKRCKSGSHTGIFLTKKQAPKK